MAESLAHVLQHVRRLLPPPGPCAETDADLVGRFAGRRDEAAFAALVARHGPTVLGVCRRLLGDAHAAEDAFQATFLVLARKAGSLRRPEAVAAWLYGVARRVAHKAARGRPRGAPLPAPAADPRPGPLDEMSARELLGIIDEEVGRLPEVYRLPVLLCCLEGLSQEEAARRLGWPPGSVKGRLERGRRRLRGRLTRRGLTLSAALAAAELARAAALSAGLTDRAVEVALAAADHRNAGAVPPVVLALADGASRGGTMVGLKAALGLLVAVLAVAGGGMVGAAGPRRAAPGAPADPLPPGAVARLGTVRFRPGSTVASIAFAPDGRAVASGNGDGTISLWEADTGRELRVLRGHRDAVLSVAFAPDGRLLASRGGGVAYNDNSIVLWDLATGREVRRFGASQGKVPPSFTGSPAWAFEVAFAPDGKLLASGAGNVLATDDTIRLWDVATGQEVRRCRGHGDRIRCFAFAPDGTLLASGAQDRTVRLWGPATGKELRRLEGHRELVRALAFSPAGTVVASAGDDKTVRLWEAATGKELRKLAVQGEPLSVAFVDAGTLAWGDTQGEIHLVDAATGKERRRLGRQPSRVGTILRSPDGKKLATAADGGDFTVHLWDVASGRRPKLAGHEAPLYCLAFAPDGRTLATGGVDGTIRLWDATTGEELRRHRELPGLGSALAFAPDGKSLAAVSDGGMVFSLHEAASFRERWRVRNPGSGWFTSCVFLPDGRTVVTGGTRFNREWDGTLCLWDVATGKELRQLKGHVNNVRSVACSPDGRLLASGGEDRTARVWDAATGKELHRLEGHDGFVMAVAFSPDGRILASGAFRAVRVWDVVTGKELRRIEDEHGITGLAFSPDGSTLAAGASGNVVRLWDVATWQEIRRWEGHRNFVQAVAFAPDGRTVASAGFDGLAMVWDVTGLLRDGRLPALRPTRPELEELWARLPTDNARRGHETVWTLVAAGRGAVDFLRQRLPPVPAADPRRLARLLADLDSASFRAREDATAALARLGEAVAPALREVLQGTPSPEVRRRLERVLGGLEAGGRLPAPRRQRRVVQALELAGTPAAGELLRAYAAGAPGARLTEDARAALRRLASGASRRVQ